MSKVSKKLETFRQVIPLGYFLSFERVVDEVRDLEDYYETAMEQNSDLLKSHFLFEKVTELLEILEQMKELIKNPDGKIIFCDSEGCWKPGTNGVVFSGNMCYYCDECWEEYLKEENKNGTNDG